MAKSEAPRPRRPCRPEDPDADAVARILDGHAAADELDRKYRQGLLNHAASSLHDRARAEAVVQDTLADAFNNVGTFQGRSSFFAWLYSIYKFRLLKEQKAVLVVAGREVEFDSPGQSDDVEDQGAARPQEADWITQIEQALTVSRQHTPERDHEQRERLLEVVKDVRELLTPQTREVFYLTMAGLSPGEIALVLKVSASDVRNHLKRGREVLKEKRDQRRSID